MLFLPLPAATSLYIPIQKAGDILAHISWLFLRGTSWTEGRTCTHSIFHCLSPPAHNK